MYLFCLCKLIAAITEKPMFFNIFATMHGNVTNMVSRPMFSWSMITIKTFKKFSHVYILPECKLFAAIEEKMIFFEIFSMNHVNVTNDVSIYMF